MTIGSPFDPSWRQVAAYIERAEREFGLVRKQLASILGVSSQSLSNWTTDNTESKISLDKLKPFAKATRMTHEELFQLVFTRLIESDGTKLQIEADLLAEAIACLLPSPEEQRVLNAYHEACDMVTFSIFDHAEYHSKLVAAMKTIASEAVSDHIAEGQA